MTPERLASTVKVDEAPVVREPDDRRIGPHGGVLLELGTKDFRIELIYDEILVTMYVLDSTATRPVSVEPDDLEVTMRYFGHHDGRTKTCMLQSVPLEDDPPGKSSRFAGTQAELAYELNAISDRAFLIYINRETYAADTFLDR